MNAAVLRSPRSLTVGPSATPDLGPDDALVRVALAGLCGTDYRIWSGDRPVTYPLIMGHEFVGRIEAIGGNVAHLRVGQRVVAEPNYSCGRCPLCLEGNRNLCPRRTAIGIDADGAFAELAALPAKCCWPVADSVPDDAAVIAEPLAVVVRAVNRGLPKPGQTAAVVGGGTLGLLALQVLRAAGVRVLVVSRSARRFALARELGADETHAVADGPLDVLSRRFSGREGVDLVVETAGTADAVNHAVALARPGGRVVLTGLPHEPTTLSFFPIVRHEITIVGSMIYQDEFPQALGLLETGRVRTGPLLTHRFDLGSIDAAFAAHRAPDSIKVTVVPRAPR
ncbi:MAG TPA: alcohol dehydrogenase catalytic domain-containing protein [Candidatus Acidoferrum sp.]|nr:alcohol dehydrogenase catalytic domain-containing protein [Candidatus Acidoferrum sp.]